MPVPTSINDLSTTAASNSPAGSDAVGTSMDDYLRIIQAMLKEAGATLYTATGTNTITFSTTPTFAAYASGQRFYVKAAGANTGATTININSLGAKNVYKDGATALVANDIPAANAVFEVVYDGTQFQLVGVTAVGNFTTLTATGNVALGDAEATDTHTIKGATTLLANSASAALTVTQTGAGNAFVVEDAASPDSTPFVVDASGNVGIGKTPTTLLDIYSATSAVPTVTGDSTTALVLARYSTDATSSNITLRKGRGTNASQTTVASSDDLGRIIFSGYGGSNNRNLANINCTVETYTSDTDISSRLTLGVSAAGGTSITERMRIASDGTVTLGGTSTAPALKVEATGSQVNWLRVLASATGNPIYLLPGGEATTDMILASAGAASVKIATNGASAEQVRITHTASANRYITLTGSNGGNPTIGTSAGSLAISPVQTIFASATATPAGGTTGTGIAFGTTSNFGIFFGSGAPSLSAAQGSLYLRSDGSSTSTRLYVNTNGTTGWTNVTTAT